MIAIEKGDMLMKRNMTITLLCFCACLLLPFQVKAEETEVTEAQFTERFDKAADYEKYNSGDDSIIESPIWIEGVAKSYNEDAKTMVVKTIEGDWAAYCGDSGNEHFYELVQEMVGKQVRVFGKYTGISEQIGLPEITFIDENIYDLPCRLENDYNSFRLFYGDYIYEKPEYDDQYTYGIATFDTSSAFRKEETKDTLFYYYTDDIPAFMMIHVDDLTDPAFDSSSEEDLLITFGEQYMKTSDKRIFKKMTEINGRKGLLCETTFTTEDCPCPMSLFSFMTIIDRHFYYFGSTQPYLSSETFKNILLDTVYSIRTDAPTNVQTSESGQSLHPKAAELDGLYTMTVEITTASGKTNKDTGENLYFGSDLFDDYNEETGVSTVKWDDFVMVLIFEYDENGNIICRGTISADNAVGTIIGIKTS